MVNSNTSQQYEDKKIITSSATLGLLRNDVISNLDRKRAKAILLRYGWNIGVEYAEEVLQSSTNLEKMLSEVDKFLIKNGLISNMECERTIKLGENDEVVKICASGKLYDSFEVHQHLKNYGISSYPICHTLAGLISGFTSKVSNREVYVKEVKCRAMGHDECCYELRVEKEWRDDPSMLEEIALYTEFSFKDETNEQIKEQDIFIERLLNFQNALTRNLSESSSIEELIRVVAQTLNIPVTIEDLNFQVRHYVGIEQVEYNTLNDDFLNVLSTMSNGKDELTDLDNTFIISGKMHTRLVTPIIVQNHRIGYMTFIYTDQCTEIIKDRMSIQRAANMAANYYLNKRTSIPAIENIKGYLLEQLLLKQYPSKSSVINQICHMGINLKNTFYVATLQFSTESIDSNNPDFYDEVSFSITSHLELLDYRILTARVNKQIVLLLPKINELKETLVNLMAHLKSQFQQIDFRLGVSDESDSIDSIQESLEESQIVLKVNKQDTIVFFENANIIGTLINSKNISIIRRKAHKQLQPILQLKATKRDELLKTMYVFLKNGGNLQQTINQLSISMSGLMYRVSKIEKLLDQELRDPITAFELLLMLNALEILGDIDVSV
ncbi:MAG TPA: V4R domain-containing protein [Ureibacillus sp.]|nr:V4R domain-containing protein [Ureibacillus sp.]